MLLPALACQSIFQCLSRWIHTTRPATPATVIANACVALGHAGSSSSTGPSHTGLDRLLWIAGIYQYRA